MSERVNITGYSNDPEDYIASSRPFCSKCLFLGVYHAASGEHCGLWICPNHEQRLDVEGANLAHPYPAVTLVFPGTFVATYSWRRWHREKFVILALQFASRYGCITESIYKLCDEGRPLEAWPLVGPIDAEKLSALQKLHRG